MIECECNKFSCNICTGLTDRTGKPIRVGNIVHWTDGGDDLTLAERIAERWDRIAIVGKEGILPFFHVIDSPSKSVREYAPCFNYGSFIYKETEKYLTVVAKSKAEYKRKFKSPGECMSWVLKETK